MVAASAEAEAALQQSLAPAVRAGIAKAVQSDAAKEAIKRFAEQQQRFRDGLTVQGCEGR
jgi:hypothetical protein